MDTLDDLLPLTNNDIVAGICGKAILIVWVRLCFAAEPYLPQFINTQDNKEIQLIYLAMGYVFSLSLHPILQAYAKMILQFCRAATWFKVNLGFMILQLLVSRCATNKLFSAICLELFLYDLEIYLLFFRKYIMYRRLF